MPYPKLMVMVSFCLKMIFLPSKIKKQIHFIDDVLEVNDQNRCILSGPPCIGYSPSSFCNFDFLSKEISNLGISLILLCGKFLCHVSVLENVSYTLASFLICNAMDSYICNIFYEEFCSVN